jgi:D-alanyl-D-alanine carboxypeptidase
MTAKKPWFDGAERLPSSRSNPMAGNKPSKKLICHTSEGPSTQSAHSLAQYVVNEAKEYSAVINSHTGDIVQIYPINTGARSLLNGGIDGGVGCNRSGQIAFQVCFVGKTAEGRSLVEDALKHDKVRRFFQWIHEWGVPAVDLTGHNRSLDWWHKSGILCHADAPGNDHTDHVPVGPIIEAMKGGAAKKTTPAKKAPAKPAAKQHSAATDKGTGSKDEQRYVVLAEAEGHDGKPHWYPIGHDDKDGFHLVRNDDNWATKEEPHIRPVKAGVKPRMEWAKANGHPKVKVMKVAKWEEHAGGGNGKLTLRQGAHWPTDKRTVERLKQVAADLGVEVRIISGLRTYQEQVALYNAYLAGRGNLAARPGTSNHEKGHAADTDVVDPKTGNLVSIGAWPGARAALKKHGLVLSVGSENWHVDPREVASWANPPIP